MRTAVENEGEDNFSTALSSSPGYSGVSPFLTDKME